MRILSLIAALSLLYENLNLSFYEGLLPVLLYHFINRLELKRSIRDILSGVAVRILSPNSSTQFALQILNFHFMSHSQYCPETGGMQRYGLAMWRKSVIRLPVTAAKFINKCSLFILLPGVIRQPGLKPNSEQKPVYIRPAAILPNRIVGGSFYLNCLITSKILSDEKIVASPVFVYMFETIPMK